MNIFSMNNQYGYFLKIYQKAAYKTKGKKNF